MWSKAQTRPRDCRMMKSCCRITSNPRANPSCSLPCPASPPPCRGESQSPAEGKIPPIPPTGHPSQGLQGAESTGGIFGIQQRGIATCAASCGVHPCSPSHPGLARGSAAAPGMLHGQHAPPVRGRTVPVSQLTPLGLQRCLGRAIIPRGRVLPRQVPALSSCLSCGKQNSWPAFIPSAIPALPGGC